MPAETSLKTQSHGKPLTGVTIIFCCPALRQVFQSREVKLCLGRCWAASWERSALVLHCYLCLRWWCSAVTPCAADLCAAVSVRCPDQPGQALGHLRRHSGTKPAEPEAAVRKPSPRHAPWMRHTCVCVQKEMEGLESWCCSAGLKHHQ